VVAGSIRSTLGIVAAVGHVAPPAGPILRRIVKSPLTSTVGAALEPSPTAGEHCHESGGEDPREPRLNTRDGRVQPRDSVISEGDHYLSVACQPVQFPYRPAINTSTIVG